MWDGKSETMILEYVFDSDYAPNEYYNEYDGDDFDYEIDVDEAKELIVDSYIELIGGKTVYDSDFIKILDELDDEELISWQKVIELNIECLEDHFKKDAMKWFVEQNYIMTEEDYEAEQADLYNDDKWLREHDE